MRIRFGAVTLNKLAMSPNLFWQPNKPRLGIVVVGVLITVVVLLTIVVTIVVSNGGGCSPSRFEEPTMSGLGQSGQSGPTSSGDVQLFTTPWDPRVITIRKEDEEIIIFGTKDEEGAVQGLHSIESEENGKANTIVTLQENSALFSAIKTPDNVTLSLAWTNNSAVKIDLWAPNGKWFSRGNFSSRHFEAAADLFGFIEYLRKLQYHGDHLLSRRSLGNSDCFTRNRFAVRVNKCGELYKEASVAGELTMSYGSDIDVTSIPVIGLPFRGGDTCWQHASYQPNFYIPVPRNASRFIQSKKRICGKAKIAINNLCNTMEYREEETERDICSLISFALQVASPKLPRLGLAALRSCNRGFSVTRRTCLLMKDRNIFTQKFCGRPLNSHPEVEPFPDNINLTVQTSMPWGEMVEEPYPIRAKTVSEDDCMPCSRGFVTRIDTVGPPEFIEPPLVVRETKGGTTFFSVHMKHICSAKQRIDYIGQFESFHECERCSSLESGSTDLVWTFCSVVLNPCCPGILFVRLFGDGGKGITSMVLRGPFCR